MSRNRFFCLAIVALFTLALSGCKSNNSTGTTSSASPSSNDMSASSANNAASANNATSASNSMSSMMGSATNLVSQLGGKEKLDSLSSSFLGNVKSNPTTSNMVSGQDTSSLTSKLSDQLNSMLGGGAKAPLTNEQIDAASIPGAAVAITHGDQVVHLAGFGHDATDAQLGRTVDRLRELSCVREVSSVMRVEGMAE